MTRRQKNILIGYFRGYLSNKKHAREYLERAEGGSLNYSRPPVKTGGENGTENKTVYFIDESMICAKKCAVVEKTAEHFEFDNLCRAIISDTLKRRTSEVKFAQEHGAALSTYYYNRDKILYIAFQWSVRFGLMTDN